MHSTPFCPFLDKLLTNTFCTLWPRSIWNIHFVHSLSNRIETFPVRSHPRISHLFHVCWVCRAPLHTTHRIHYFELVSQTTKLTANNFILICPLFHSSYSSDVNVLSAWHLFALCEQLRTAKLQLNCSRDMQSLTIFHLIKVNCEECLHVECVTASRRLEHTHIVCKYVQVASTESDSFQLLVAVCSHVRYVKPYGWRSAFYRDLFSLVLTWHRNMI